MKKYLLLMATAAMLIVPQMVVQAHANTNGAPVPSTPVDIRGDDSAVRGVTRTTTCDIKCVEKGFGGNYCKRYTSVCKTTGK